MTTPESPTRPISTAETATTSVPSPWSASRICCYPDWVAGLTEGDDTDIVAADFGNAPIPVAVATTEVNIPLADIVAGKHAINVESPNPDDPEDSVACANIGGVVDEHGDLFVGLGEQMDSGHYGVVWLHDNGTSTTIVVFLAHPDEAAGIEAALAALAAAEEEAAATPVGTPEATPVRRRGRRHAGDVADELRRRRRRGRC